MEIDYLAAIRRETDALVAVARRAPAGAMVPACPEWDVAALCAHLNRIQRWATGVALTGQAPDGFPKVVSPDVAIDALANDVGPLIDALSAINPTSGWTFTGSNNGGEFWHRRQAQEVMVHRWDAESAVGAGTPFDPDLAADGLYEAFRVLAPFRLKVRKGDLPTLSGDLHLHATDADSEWVIDAPGGELTISNRHRKSAAALRGTASDLLLFMWRRIGPDNDRLSIVGDHTIVQEFYDWKLLG